ncbi:unnamed protein product [Hymenolepis diminuta]|uniref:Uncharacterized protein n=1 Tax=Hymenolepis diminuta TaxID=6216 RepID=A0A564YG55_HYMDI|nr:unnamed protein product [Hymenolepis diminuta]
MKFSYFSASLVGCLLILALITAILLKFPDSLNTQDTYFNRFLKTPPSSFDNGGFSCLGNTNCRL